MTTPAHQLGRPRQRVAREADAPRIAEVMRASVLATFSRVYTVEQTASAAAHITHPDAVIIADGTYFVHEVAGDIVACGGWSRRARLHGGSETEDGDMRLLDPATEPARIRAMFVRREWTRHGLGRAILLSSQRAARAEGFRALILMATLPGVPLYASFGFTGVEHEDIVMPDGTSIAGVRMTRSIDSRPDR